MFNDYNETPLIPHNEFHLEKEKKQENVPKWSYGQPSSSFFSNRSSEIWCGKPNYIEISNDPNFSPKCNCSGCYSSKSYQSDSTRLRSWLPKPFSVPKNNSIESCKLPEQNQWNNVGLPNQSSCFSENNIQTPQCVQAGGEKHPYYRQFSNARVSEPNQPGVIITAKKSEYAKEDFLSKQKGYSGAGHEVAFYGQNGVRQSVFCNAGYNLEKNFDKRIDNQNYSSNFRDSTEKFSVVDSYECSVNSVASTIDQSKLSVVEPFIKAVPSDNQNRVPLSGDRNFKEHAPQSVMYQNCDSRKNVSLDPCAVFSAEKNSRTLYQLRLEKEGIEHFHVGQTIHNAPSPATIETKNSEIHLSHQMYNNNCYDDDNNRDISVSQGSFLEGEGQGLLENVRSEFCQRNSYSDNTNKIKQSSVVDMKKDCIINSIGQINFSDLRYGDLSKSSGALENYKHSEMFFIKDYNTEKVYKQDVLGRLQQNPNFFQKNENLVQNKNSSFQNLMCAPSLTHNDPRDFCFNEKTLLPCPHPSAETDFRNSIRPNFSHQGYDSQDRYKNTAGTYVISGLQRNEFSSYHSNPLQQAASNFGGVNRQFSPQTNTSFMFNPPLQQLGHSETVEQQHHSHKNSSCDLIQKNPTVPQNYCANFVSRPLDIMKNSYLETIRRENVNKNKSNKISPLRLLRKKKLVPQLNDNASGSPALVSSHVAAPVLDVRRFWSTWAEEEEENIGPTQMVVLDCQNIDPEEAKFLQFYESDPVRDIHVENNNSSQVSRDSECVASHVTLPVDVSAGEVLTSMESSAIELKSEHSTTKSVFENRNDLTEKEEIVEKADSLESKIENVSPSVPLVEGRNYENSKNCSLNVGSYDEKKILESNPSDLTCHRTDTKFSKKTKQNKSEDNKEIIKNKKINLKPKSNSPPDKWTEKKLEFLKRAEESKAAEILRHEKEKKKIFERRLSFKKGNVYDGAKTVKINSIKSNSDSENVQKIFSDVLGSKNTHSKEQKETAITISKKLSWDENFRSQSPNSESSTMSDLPTSEYRRNKFLDYSEQQTIFNCVASNEKYNKSLENLWTYNEEVKNEMQLSDKSSASDNEGNLSQEYANNRNHFNCEKLMKSELGSLDFKNVKKIHETDVQSLNLETKFENIIKNSYEDETKPKISDKIKMLSDTKKTNRNKKAKLKESDESSEKVTVENISSSKPTIKFSIQKSHDLKISFKVLNAANKKFENLENEDKTGKKESERQETDVDNSTNSTECITLKLKSINRDHSNHGKLRKLSKKVPASKNLDSTKKYKRRMKRKRLNGNLFKVTDNRNLAAKKQVSLIDDTIYENCLKPSKNMDDSAISEDFQVREKIDSAKIKLTFKRNRLNNRKLYEDNQLPKEKFYTIENLKPKNIVLDTEDSQSELKIKEKPEILQEPCALSVKSEPSGCEATFYTDNCSKYGPKVYDLNLSTEEDQHHSQAFLEPFSNANHEKLSGENKTHQGLLSNSKLPISAQIHSDVDHNAEEELPQKKNFTWDESLVKPVTCTEGNIHRFKNELPKYENPAEQTHDYEENVDFNQEAFVCEDGVLTKADILIISDKKSLELEHVNKEGSKESVPLKSNNDFLVKYCNESIQSKPLRETTPVKSNSDNLVIGHKNTMSTEDFFEKETLTNFYSDQSYQAPLVHNRNITKTETNDHETYKNMGKKIEYGLDIDIYCCKNSVDTPRQKSNDDKNERIESTKINKDTDFDHYPTNLVQNFTNDTLGSPKSDDSHMYMMVNSQSEEACVLKSNFCSANQNADFPKKMAIAMSSVEKCNNKTLATESKSMILSESTEKTPEDLIFHLQNQTSMVEETFSKLVLNKKVKDLGDDVGNTENTGNFSQLSMCEAPDNACTVFSTEDSKRPTAHLLSPEYTQYKLDEQVLEGDKPDLFVASSTSSSYIFNTSFNYNSCFESTEEKHKPKTFFEIENEDCRKIHDNEGDDFLSSLVKGNLLENRSSDVREVNLSENESNKECANISKGLGETNVTLHLENCEKAEKAFTSGFEVCFQNSMVSSECITKEKNLHALDTIKNSENLFSPSILPSKKSTCANKAKVKRRFSFEADVLKKKKSNQFGKANLKKVTAQSAFTYSRWKSHYIRAHSCPPSINFVQRANLVVPIIDIPIKDIPLPLGNPPPENCFDLERYFKLPKPEKKTESLLTKIAVDLEKRADCLTEANERSKKRLVVKNCLSQLEKKSTASGENLSPSQKDKRHQNSSKFFPLFNDEKKFKVKFSLAKPKSLKSVLWDAVNKSNGYLKNKQKCSVFQSDLKEELSPFFKKINLDSNSNVENLDTNLKMSVYSENLEKKPKTDISKKSAALSSEILTSAVRKTFLERPIISTCNVQDKKTKLEKSRCESFSAEIPTDELPNGFDGESVQKEVKTESVYCEETKVMGTEIVETVQDVPATVNLVKEQRNFIEEFYECEDIPTSEDLPHDVEVSKVSDDDIFRNIMQNCIDNAKKFFSVRNLKLFSYSMDDFLELDHQLPEPMTDENGTESGTLSVSTNHISRDVLLSSCEETVNDDLKLSEKSHLEDMPIEFVPSFCSENSHNLCPEILPVENWPYLEEEVPASPSKLKSEETDFTPKLENFTGLKTTKYKNLSVNSIRKTIENFDWNRASEILFPDSKKFKRYRRRSFMSDGETYQKCSILTLERRKTTDESSGNYSLCQKSSKKISDLKDEVREIESNRIIQSFKCCLSLDKISKNNYDNKTMNHSFFCKSAENKFTKDFRSKSIGQSASNYSLSLKYTDSNSCKKRKFYNYKSSVWQPKVVLFRISKQELRRFCRSSHSSPTKVRNSCDGYTVSNSKNKINNKNFNSKQMSMENNLTSMKSDSNVNVIKPDDTKKMRIAHKVNERATSVSSFDQEKKEHSGHLNVEINVSNVDCKNTLVSDTAISSGFAENFKETIKELLNSGTSKVFKFRKRKKRFRNLHTKEKSDYNIKNSARALKFSAQKTKSENRHVLKKIISEGVDLPKEREFNSDDKSTKKLTDVKCKSGREKSAEINNASHLPSSSKKTKVSSTSISDKKIISSCIGDKEIIHSSDIIKRRLCKSKSDKPNKSLSGFYKEKVKTSSSKCSHRDRREENKWESHSNQKSGGNQKEVFKYSEKNSDINRNDGKISIARRERNNDPQYFSIEKNDLSESDSKPEELKCAESSLECPWVCEVCGFHDATKRVVHIVSHPFHCQSCHLAFKTEARFVIHLTKKHKDIRNQHHCLLCEMSFDTEDQYRRHLETREHKHLESVEKNTINTLFTLLTGEPCPVLGFVEMKPEWLPNQAGTVHFYHQATPLSLALQYLKMHQDISSLTSLSSSNHPN